MESEVRDGIMDRGIRTYNFSDLTDNPRFRNTVVLKAFYEIRIAELGFQKGQAAVVENPFRPGLPYNLHLIREFGMDTTAFKNWMPRGAN